MSPAQILGIHHVTAICGDPQKNLDFYAGVLGLRLVKLTVNFDDQSAYHFYYGDGAGTPGTILTFFPFPGARKGKHGNGAFGPVAFAVPPGSLPFWTRRLMGSDVRAVSLESERPDWVDPNLLGLPGEGGPALALRDPDGMSLLLVESPRPRAAGWADDPVGPEHAITGIHSVTLATASPSSRRLIEEALGLVPLGEAQGFVSGRDAIGIAMAGESESGGLGTIHHVALRVASDAVQAQFQQSLMAWGAHVSPVKDRTYFHSIYFREPGGALFEIATDPPGFTVDESPEALGTFLRLPPQYEPHREQIQRALPTLRLPGVPRG